jgi:hypothetical protein
MAINTLSPVYIPAYIKIYKSRQSVYALFIQTRGFRGGQSFEKSFENSSLGGSTNSVHDFLAHHAGLTPEQVAQIGSLLPFKYPSVGAFSQNMVGFSYLSCPQNWRVIKAY